MRKKSDVKAPVNGYECLNIQEEDLKALKSFPKTLPYYEDTLSFRVSAFWLNFVKTEGSFPLFLLGAVSSSSLPQETVHHGLFLDHSFLLVFKFGSTFCLF